MGMCGYINVEKLDIREVENSKSGKFKSGKMEKWKIEK